MRIVIAMIALLLLPGAQAANRFSVATGNWSATATWGTACGGGGGSSVPGAGDNATICAGTTVTVNAAVTVNTVTINGTLNGSSNTLTIASSPAITINAGGSLVPGTGTIDVSRDGATTVVQGTAASITFYNLNLGPVATSGVRVYTLGAIPITVNNNLSIDTTGTSAARSLTVNMGAAVTVAGTTLIQGGGTGPSPATLNTSASNFNLTSGYLNIGASGTLTANGSTVTLNGGCGATCTLFTRSGTFTAGTSTVVMNSPASVTLTSGTFTLTNAFNKLTVSMAGQTGTLGSAITVNTTLLVSAGTLSNGGFAITGDGTGTFQVNDGATFRMTGAAAFPPVSGGTHFSTYTFQCGSYPTCSTVQYRQSNAQTISAQTYGHLEVNPSANGVTDTFPAGALSINGDLSVGGTNTGVAADASVNSTTLTVGGDVTINANSTLKAHASNGFTVAGDWTDNGTFNPNGGTVTLNGTAGQTLGGSGSRVFNNLSLSPGSAATTTLGANYTVNGTLTLNANAILADGGNILTAKGAVANSGSHTGTGKILLNGGSSQALSGTGAYTNLELNNASGATLSANVTVNGTLTLTSGDVVTGSNVLKMGSAATVTGAAAAKHVVGNVEKAYAAAGSFTFPVGDGTNYSPITLNFSTLVTPGNVTASTTNAEHPDTTAAADGLDKNKSLNRYWTVKNSSLAGSYTATFVYVAGDRDAGVTVSGANLPNVFIKQGNNCSGTGASRTCAAWTAATLSGTPTTTQASAAAVTITSVPTEVDFALGEPAITNFAREQQFIYTRELY